MRNNMELKNLTEFPTDYIDAYCESKVGHTNWAFVDSVHPTEVEDGDIESIIVIYKEAE